MKKILAIAMAIVMMMAIAVPSFAADLSAKDTDAGDVIITTKTEKADRAENNFRGLLSWKISISRALRWNGVFPRWRHQLNIHVQIHEYLC